MTSAEENHLLMSLIFFNFLIKLSSFSSHSSSRAVYRIRLKPPLQKAFKWHGF